MMAAGIAIGKPPTQCPAPMLSIAIGCLRQNGIMTMGHLSRLRWRYSGENMGSVIFLATAGHLTPSEN